MMDAGKLRHRVQVQSVTRTDDDYGGYAEAWATSATVWARVTPNRGGVGERLDRGTVAAVQRWDVLLRHRTLNTDDRLVWDGRVLEVEQVIPDAVEAWLTVRCREDRNAGES